MNRPTDIPARQTLNFRLSALVVLSLLLTGCAGPAEPIFSPVALPLQWPPMPRAARIVYVGQLSTSGDLKPVKPFLTGVGEAVFGKSVVSGVLSPFAICSDDADRLFVADTGSQRIHVFNVKTRQYQQWKPQSQQVFTEPVGVAWDPAGRLIVSDSVAGCLFVFDGSGKSLGTLGDGLVMRPAGLVINRSTRQIFVCDLGTHQIVVLSSDGKLINRIGHRGAGPGEFNFPTNLAIDSKGNLYVADALNFRIQVFDSELCYIRSFGRPGNLPGYFGQPKGIAFDADDHLYVVDNRQELVQLFDREGQLLLFFGGEGNAAGQFWLPCGICIDSHNRIWIADTYNKRVQVFDYLPEKQP